MLMYKVAEPNEALIISGLRAHHGPEGDAAGLGFKIVVGKGAFVVPGLQKVRRLSLDIHEAELDFASIANAARRFLEQEDQMDVKVHNVFAGHLRAIIGTMTVEDLIRNRDKLTQATRESAANEMQRLGLTIDSLQLQDITDQTDYIQNVSMPEAARVAKEARIAEAQADREATEREQESEALKAAARSDSQIRQAEVMAQAQQAQARAEQAGPLAAATARQQVVVQETKVAELEAQRTEQRLQAEVRKPADAEAYKQRTLAEGEREAVKAKGLAEAEAIRARAQALAQNQEAVIAQQIAEQLPQVVGEAAKAFGNIGQMTVLNGAEGIGQMFSQVLGMGAAAVPMIRNLLTENGAAGPRRREGEQAAEPRKESRSRTR